METEIEFLDKKIKEVTLGETWFPLTFHREMIGIQPPQGNLCIIYTIHSGSTMSRNTQNSHKRYAREIKDIHHSVYTLMHKPIFLINFEKRKTLPPYDDPLVIMVKVTHWEMHKVLVDNGNSLEFLYFLALLNMGIDPKEII